MASLDDLLFQLYAPQSNTVLNAIADAQLASRRAREAGQRIGELSPYLGEIIAGRTPLLEQALLENTATALGPQSALELASNIYNARTAQEQRRGLASALAQLMGVRNPIIAPTKAETQRILNEFKSRGIEPTQEDFKRSARAFETVPTGEITLGEIERNPEFASALSALATTPASTKERSPDWRGLTQFASTLAAGVNMTSKTPQERDAKIAQLKELFGPELGHLVEGFIRAGVTRQTLPSYRPSPLEELAEMSQSTGQSDSEEEPQGNLTPEEYEYLREIQEKLKKLREGS